MKGIFIGTFKTFLTIFRATNASFDWLWAWLTFTVFFKLNIITFTFVVYEFQIRSAVKTHIFSINLFAVRASLNRADIFIWNQAFKLSSCLPITHVSRHSLISMRLWLRRFILSGKYKSFLTSKTWGIGFFWRSF